MTGAEPRLSRRALLKAGATTLGAVAVLGAGGRLGAVGSRALTPGSSVVIDDTWWFGRLPAGQATPVTAIPSQWSCVPLPHVVAELDYDGWDPTSWEQLWGYARALPTASGIAGRRVFVDFDGVLTTAVVAFNGTTLTTHAGGYTPFSCELTDLWDAGGANLLSVVVDGRWQPDVPPGGGEAAAIDYLQPAGIHRSVHLRTVPSPAHIADVFSNPEVVDGNGDVTVQVTIDSLATTGAGELAVVIVDAGGAVVRAATTAVAVTAGTGAPVTLVLRGAPLALWSPETPSLYTVRATLTDAQGATVDTTTVRSGYRSVRWTTSGLTLNGRRRVLQGLGRHEIGPYRGHAFPARFQARDADILKGANLDFVRTAHYPHDPSFLDACDTVGLCVWEETPGWGNLGSAAATGTPSDNDFDALWADDCRAMVLRDRSRPSVIIWGAQPNETSPSPTTAQAVLDQVFTPLDPDRATAGAMELPAYANSSVDYIHPVAAVNDYEAGSLSASGVYQPARTNSDLTATGAAYLSPPLQPLPWLVTEAVGALLSPGNHYQNSDQYPSMVQGLYHAEVHAQARAAGASFCGVSAWCAFDYQSDWGLGHDGAEPGLRCPGVWDTFRNPKRAAGFYRTQGSPSGPSGPLVLPGFAWCINRLQPGDPRSVTSLADPSVNPYTDTAGRGLAVIWTNCDEVQVYFDNVLQPTPTASAAAGLSALARPPAWMYPPPPGTLPELHLVGLVGGRVVCSQQYSPVGRGAKLVAGTDAAAIVAGGSDVTRVWVLAVDRHGNHLPYASGQCSVAISGPGRIVGLGARGFDLAATGGSGAIWVRSAYRVTPSGAVGSTGLAAVTFSHPSLGTASVPIQMIGP